jgi:DNA-binding MarR family transcriptional regulator
MSSRTLARAMVQRIPAARLLPDLRPGIRLLARLARVAEQACQSTGISLPQYRLLVSIAAEPQRASNLALCLDVSRPTLTSLVDGLEHMNLLKRTPVASDRRGVLLELTEEGRLATLRAEHALTERLLRLMNGDVARIVAHLEDVVLGLGSALDLERQEPTKA